MHQSDVMQSVIGAGTVFLKSYTNALSVFIACAALACSSVQVAPEQACAAFSNAEAAPEHARCGVFERPERTHAVFPNAKVADGRASAAFTGAQVAPEHACAAFYRVFTCFLEPSGSGSEAPRRPRTPNRPNRL